MTVENEFNPANLSMEEYLAVLAGDDMEKFNAVIRWLGETPEGYIPNTAFSTYREKAAHRIPPGQCISIGQSIAYSLGIMPC
jgi:hypothetical protein